MNATFLARWFSPSLLRLPSRAGSNAVVEQLASEEATLSQDVATEQNR